MTAEFAITMPAVLLLLGIMVGAFTAAVGQVRLADAAADVARSLGRGDTDAAGLAARVAPGAHLAITTDGDLVCVDLDEQFDWPIARELGVRLTAHACALRGGL